MLAIASRCSLGRCRSVATARLSSRSFARHASAPARASAVSGAVAVATLAACGAVCHLGGSQMTAMCAARLPDVTGMRELTVESATGIKFGPFLSGMTLVGTGHRRKYGFVKVYAIGTYVDPISLMAVKKAGSPAIEQALVNPVYPRTIRIVMNRNLSIDKFTDAIVEALKPRMKEQDMGLLEEFKKLNPPVDLIEGAEILITIRGDTLIYQNGVGELRQIRAGAMPLNKALCELYYGPDCICRSHKDEVVRGVANL